MRALPIAMFLLVTSAASVYAGPAVTTAEKKAKSGAQPQTAAPQVNPRSLELNEKGVVALQAKDFKRAEELLLGALSADAGNVTAAYNLASVYLTQKKFPEAITLLKQYISKSPEDAGLSARLGDTYFAMKNAKDAVTAYEAALAKDPKFPGVSAKLGTLYTMSNRLPDAEKSLLNAVELDPGNGDLLANLAALFLANGKPVQAVQTAKRALQVKPVSRVYVTMGNAYEVQADLKNALIAYQRAADLGDTSSELKKKIEALQKNTAAK